MTEQVDFLNLMTDADKNINNFWLDDKQFKFIPQKLLVMPYNVNLSLAYPDVDYTEDDFISSIDDLDTSDDNDTFDSFTEDDDEDLSLDDSDDDELTKPDRMPVCEITIHFIHGSIAGSIMNSNMDEEIKWKTVRMLKTTEAHIIKPDDLTPEASMTWDDWAYDLEKLNSRTNSCLVLKDFEGHIYPDGYFRIIDLPDIELFPFED